MIESAAPDVVSFGARLTQIRAGVSQPVRADAFGVHKNTYARWERGDAEMPASALAVLASEGWNLNWLLTGHGPQRIEALQVVEGAAAYGSQELSGEDLSIAVELVDEALGTKWLPRRRYWDLVAKIYDGVTQGLPYAEILAFARPAALEMAGEQRDDSGEEVGGAGASDPGGGDGEAPGDR